MLAEKIHNEDNVWFPNVPVLGFRLKPLRSKLMAPNTFRYYQVGEKKKARACPPMLAIALYESEGFSKTAEDFWRYVFCFSKKRDYTIAFNSKRFSFASGKSEEDVKKCLNELIDTGWLKVCEFDGSGEYSKLELGSPVSISEIVEQSIYIQAAERDLEFPYFEKLPNIQYSSLKTLFARVNYDF